MRSASLRQTSRPGRRGVLLLLALLVLAQSMGLIHRSLHGDAGDPPHARAGIHAHAAIQTGESAGLLGGLFGDHADASECLLFDVIAQPGCAPALAPIQAFLPPNVLLAATSAEFVARWSALAYPRGPPRAH